MAENNYVTGLTSPENGLSGKDIPLSESAGVIDGLCHVISEKETVISEKDKQIEKLQRELMWLRRRMFGSSSEKLTRDAQNQLSFDFGESAVPALLSDDELKAAERETRDAMESVHSEANRRRAQKNAQTTRKGEKYRISDDIPRDEPVLLYPDGYSPDTHVVIGWNRHEYLEVIPQRLHVRVEHEAICKPIGARPTDPGTIITEARSSQNCLPGCVAGNTLMAAIVTDKFCHHLPEYRQVKRFKSLGVDLNTSSINRWMHALAGNLMPLYEAQTALVFSSRYQHIDESTIRINDSRGKTRKGYIWSAVDGMGERGLAFFYDKGSRGGKVLRPRLIGNKAIQSDGYAVYENIEKSDRDNIITLYCMAHARRKFESIKDVSAEATDILEKISLLYELEANLKHRNADHDEIRRERQQKAVPILNLIHKSLKVYVTRDTPASSLAAACNYALRHWDGLCRYCEQGYYDIDNNIVERSIRPLTLGRKNWLFVDSDESAQDTALYLTLIGSCNLLGIDPLRYFNEILPKIHRDMTSEECEALLPYSVARSFEN